MMPINMNMSPVVKGALTFIPAMVALGITGRVKEREVFVVRWLKGAYGPKPSLYPMGSAL